MTIQQNLAVATVLKSIGNKYRVQILEQLLHHESCNVGELNRLIPISQPAMSQHLAKLRKARVVSSKRNQREIYYSMNENQKKLVYLILNNAWILHVK